MIMDVDVSGIESEMVDWYICPVCGRLHDSLSESSKCDHSNVDE